VIHSLNRCTATWNLFVLYNKKNTQLQLFISKSFSITWKPAFTHFGKHEKKPFDVICFLYKMKQSHWLLCRNKELWLVKKNHATVKLDSSGFSWKENLQQMQNWTAKSTSVKENAGKINSVFVLRAALWAKNQTRLMQIGWDIVVYHIWSKFCWVYNDWFGHLKNLNISGTKRDLWK